MTCTSHFCSFKTVSDSYLLEHFRDVIVKNHVQYLAMEAASCRVLLHVHAFTRSLRKPRKQAPTRLYVKHIDHESHVDHRCQWANGCNRQYCAQWVFRKDQC